MAGGAGMSAETVYHCDVCGVQKGVVNHWWIAFRGQSIRFCRWTEREANRVPGLHLCGQACAQKLLDEFLSEAPR